MEERKEEIMKKRKRVLGLFLSSVLVMNALTGCTSAVQKKKEGVFTILTSFYPMYVITENITDGVDGVEIRNLANPSTGCLHDYQLRPMDMANMEQTDVMVINGAGMEEFLDDAKKGITNLHIIDATEGLSLLESDGHHSHEHSHEEDEHNHEEDEDSHEEDEHNHEEDEHSHEEDEHNHEEDEHNHDEHEHSHGEYNAHAWISTELYKQQVQVVADGLAKADPSHATQYENNAKQYIKKIEALQTLMEEMKSVTEGKKIVIFHEAFAYLAQELGMEVVESMEVESDAGLSAGQIKDLIDEVKDSGADLLLSEKQYSGNIGHTVEEETGILDLTLDSCVTGDMDKDSYLKAMEENLRVLKEALSDGSQLRISLH